MFNMSLEGLWSSEYPTQGQKTRFWRRTVPQKTLFQNLGHLRGGMSALRTIKSHRPLGN